MNIQIKTTGGLVTTPAITDYVNKRISHIEKFLHSDPSAVAHVELSKMTNHHKHGDIFSAKVRVVVKGKEFFASAERADLYVAVDGVRDEITRELTHLKEKRLAMLRRGGAKVKNMIKGIWN
jgi:ribosomal subunit interface protein